MWNFRVWNWYVLSTVLELKTGQSFRRFSFSCIGTTYKQSYSKKNFVLLIFVGLIKEILWESRRFRAPRRVKFFFSRWMDHGGFVGYYLYNWTFLYKIYNLVYCIKCMKWARPTFFSRNGTFPLQWAEPV